MKAKCLTCSKKFETFLSCLKRGGGKYCSLKCRPIKNRGEKNGNWAGDKILYRGLHLWVVRNKGKAQICIKCGSSKKIEWASKSHEAKRDLSDYISLCPMCHGIYDTGYKKKRR